MAEDWLTDVRKYAAEADENVVGAIVRYCGIALHNRDSSLVSISDKTETDRVRENYLKKKLGLTHDDPTLDSAIASVGERMGADRTKNRVTVYYLLADHFGALHLFGAAARAAGAGAAGAAALAAAQPSSPDRPRIPPVETSASPPPPRAAPPRAATPAMAVVGRPAAGARTGYWASGDGGIIGNISWGVLASVVGGVLVAGFLAMGLVAMRHRPVAAPVDSTAQTVPVMMQAAPVAAAPAPPAGAGVIAAEREARPMLTVYFDTGKADVTSEIAAAAAPVKAYVETHPGATLAVSGFNDPTGNAAANAELSKHRAQNVKAALEGTGIAADKVMLEKPAETTGTGATDTESRRVEVVVRE